ncbi:uncharacterized protein [Choristoneura fumiferana]|uniref:uncharacterized protein n=1 Tax=Choristoneura fumiferana TaxID=7141 RepID=UPI003D15D588
MARSVILITLIFSVHQKISFGQLNAGNNFSMELNKISALQQQSHKTSTDTTITADNNGNTRNVQYLNGANFNTPNENNTKTIVNGNTISNIKFVRNQAFNAPLPSPALSMVKGNGQAPHLSQGNFRSVFISANPTIDRLNTTAQTPIRYADINAGSLSKSPLYISFGSPPIASLPTQTSLLANVQPILSSVQFVPNTVKLQTSASPSQKQGSPQTLASFLIPPTNVQNQAKLLYAQTPPPALPTQPLTPAPDNTVQSRHSLTSLLLSHLLSQNYNVEDPSSPIMNHYPNRNSKPSSIKVLLPLLLSLLYERNNECCECEKYHRCNKCKPEKMYRRFKDNSVEINSKPDMKDRFIHAWHVDNYDRLQGETSEEEDYSDDISDYSNEYYDTK